MNTLCEHLALLAASFVFLLSILYKFYLGFIDIEFLLRDFVIFIILYFVCKKLFKLIYSVVESYKELL